jgi:AP endonuclease-2
MLDIVNPDGVFVNGSRQTIARSPSKPKLGMKQFPEYSQRQSIKDMFRQLATRASPDTTQVSHQLATAETTSEPLAKRTKTSRSTVFPPSRQRRPREQKSLQTFFAQRSSQLSDSNTSDNSPLCDPLKRNISGPQPLLNEEFTQSENEQQSSGGGRLVIDRVRSKEEWTKLFSKRPTPLCTGHGEPCLQLTTKKPGPNFGRAFWMCARCFPLLRGLSLTADSQA